MRISSISVAQPRNLNYRMKTKNAQTQPVSLQQPSFKGWKGFAGSVGGTVLGGVTGFILTGGLGVIPFIIAGAGAIAGGEYGKSKENNKNNDDFIDQNPTYPNYRDY